MARRIRYTARFKQAMIEFFEEHPEASFDQAQEKAKELKALGNDTISKSMYDDLQRKARGPVEAPDQWAMDLKTGVFKKLESARGGDLVAIYKLERRARIQVNIIDE